MAEEDIQAEPPEPPRPRKKRAAEEEERRPRRSRRDRDDDDDDYDRRRGPTSSGVDQVIPYHNPKALIAYYLGVFSLIPIVGLALGPAALILGILGIRASNANPKAHGMVHAIVGIVLGASSSWCTGASWRSWSSRPWRIRRVAS